jgi:S-adenosylmethionine:tRNA ribosyltransferase-isomerase
MAARLAVNQGGNLARAQAVRASWFDYDLPPAKIALRPVHDRSSSRLLVARNAPGSSAKGMSLAHHNFHELPSLLPDSSLLVMNNSQVIPARIPMRKATGAKAEILLLSPSGEVDTTAALDMALEEGHSWKCIVGGRRIRSGDVLESESGAVLLKAEILSRDGTAAVVRFHTDAVGLSLAMAIQSIGKTPLPPYIRRAADADDVGAYQTIYAKRAGSVAAPTAGLHMTDEVMKNVRARGVHISTVTLHVGAGTFAPLGGPTAGDHRMHAERFTVSAETMRRTAECARDRRQLTALVRNSVSPFPMLL